MTNELVNIIFGMKIRQARQAQELTLAELAAASDLSPSYMTEIEKGRKYPRADKILRIAKALDKDYDDLVSIKLSPTLAYLETALSSPLLREFPFEQFGLDFGHVVDLLTRAPAQASALIHAILEIGRQYDLKEEHFLRAMLRSYQELNENYFPELEEAAERFAEEYQLPEEPPLTLDYLRNLIEEKFSYQLEETMLAADPDLAGYRSVYISGPKPKLLVNSLLRPLQIKFLLAREIGYHFLGLQERSHMSTPDQVDSFRQVYNDFQASYFAGAILMPRQTILRDVKAFFALRTWQPEQLLAMLNRYEVTPEMLCYRFSEIIPQFFGLKLHFLRLHRVGNRYRLIKRLNMNHLPVPSGLALYEHYCRRWLTAQLLQEMEDEGGPAAFQERRPLVGVQFSEFLHSPDRFLCLGFARPLSLSPNVSSSVIVGFREEGDLAQTIQFTHDPHIPRMIINETCERCSLTEAECSLRAAEPIVLREQKVRQRRREALNKLMAQFRG